MSPTSSSTYSSVISVITPVSVTSSISASSLSASASVSSGISGSAVVSSVTTMGPVLSTTSFLFSSSTAAAAARTSTTASSTQIIFFFMFISSLDGFVLLPRPLCRTVYRRSSHGISSRMPQKSESSGKRRNLTVDWSLSFPQSRARRVRRWRTHGTGNA